MGQRIETVAMLQGVDRGGLATRVVKPPEVSPRARGDGPLNMCSTQSNAGQPARAWGFVSDRIRGVGGVAFVSNGQLVR